MDKTKDNILKDLNPRQSEAVVSEEKRLLVLAGAGSGKTKTLLQKIVYLIFEKGVKPANILAITFTKNAANEMIDRLIILADDRGEYKNIIFDKKLNQKQKDFSRVQYVKKFPWISKLTIKTFHSLCYQMLRNYGANEFDNKFKMLSDTVHINDHLTQYTAPENFFDIIHKILIEKCNNKEYLLNLKRYILDFYVDKVYDKDFKYKSDNYDKPYTSLKGDKVRSKSERYIADWFYRHNIKYNYEPIINIKDFDFKPDFYIIDADIYLEHESNISYPTKDKEEQFRKGNLKCFKTYESMASSSALFNRALERIVKGRIPTKHEIVTDVIFEEEFKGYHNHISEFLRMVLRITDKIKVEGDDFDKVYEKAQKDQHERIRMFYWLSKPLFEGYCNYCTDRSYMDFNDLILKSINLFDKQSEIKEKYISKFKYILVDEFQDVNKLQVTLLSQLLSEETQLFCVGDDWQSIYGFRGSEVDYIVNFEKHFKHAKIITLDINYRSTEAIVNASNEVIKHNKFRIEKEVTAFKQKASKIIIYRSNEPGVDDVAYLVNKANQLIKDGYANDDILVLYRRTKMFESYKKALWDEKLKIPAKTIPARHDDGWL